MAYFAALTASVDDPRLRVLVLITRSEPGGAQVHVRDLVLGLRANVHFHVGVGDDLFLAQALRGAGIAVSIVPSLQRSVSPVHDLRAVGDLRRLIRQVQPDLVHTHSTKAGLLGRFAARLERVPVIHTAHAWSFSDGLSWQRRAFAIPVEAAAGRITNRFIVVSEADREVAVRYGVAREAQVRIVHNGVCDGPERADPGEEAVPVITMVARMAAPKDHALLLRAVAALQAPFTLRLIGDGPERPAVESLIRELDLGSRVELVGESNDVARHLAASHVSVLISRQEGFPLVVLEAMRAGLPVVASDVGGIREAVEPGVTGHLVARADVVGLRGALVGLISHPGVRRSYGEAGRRAYEARFTVDRMVAGTHAVYRELAAAKGIAT